MPAKTNPKPPTVNLDPIIPIREVASIGRMSMPGVYAAIAAGHLQSFLIGRRRMVRQSAVVAWLDYLEQQSNAGRPVIYRPRGA